MDRFLSHHVNRFDSKGRISVPASFRAVLSKEAFEGVFAHPSLESPALDCGGRSLLRQIETLLETTAPYSREREDLATAFLGTGEHLKLDGEGRVTLPERMRALLGAADEAVFVGQGYKFQIWAPDLFAAHLAEATARARAMRSRASAPMTQGARE